MEGENLIQSVPIETLGELLATLSVLREDLPLRILVGSEELRVVGQRCIVQRDSPARVVLVASHVACGESCSKPIEGCCFTCGTPRCDDHLYEAVDKQRRCAGTAAKDCRERREQREERHGNGA